MVHLKGCYHLIKFVKLNISGVNRGATHMGAEDVHLESQSPENNVKCPDLIVCTSSRVHV